MSRQIAGFITEFDEWGRFRVLLPRERSGVDSLNTEVQLRTFGAIRTGWTPIKKKSYIAKPSGACFAYHNGKQVQDYKLLVQHSVIFEVDLMPFAGGDDGWWIKIASIRVTD